MRDKLSKTKDILVFIVSFEVNILLTLFLFRVDIWDHIWAVARINIAALFLYGWLWFVEYYLSNWSTSALIDKQIELENKKLEVMRRAESISAPEKAAPVEEVKEKIEIKEEPTTTASAADDWVAYDMIAEED